MLAVIHLLGDELATWLKSNNPSPQFPSEEQMRFMFQNSPPALAVKLQKAERIDDLTRMKSNKAAALDMLRRTALMWVADAEIYEKPYFSLSSEGLNKLKTFAAGGELTPNLASTLTQLMFLKLSNNMRIFNKYFQKQPFALTQKNVDLTGAIASYQSAIQDQYFLQTDLARAIMDITDLFEQLALNLLGK